MDPERIAAAEARFGRPRVKEFGPLECLPGESVMVDRAATRGRNHDVSLWIPRELETAPNSRVPPGETGVSSGRFGVVVIRKHSYPKWLFRLPSGAVHDGESAEEGLKREAKEETGLDVEVEAYLLRASTTLGYWRTWAPGGPPPPPGAFAPLPAGPGDRPRERAEVPWVSHLFLARATGGVLDPVDKREIADIRVADLDEFRTILRDNLVRVGGGFQFRGWITDALAEAGFPGPRSPTRRPGPRSRRGSE